MPAGMATKANAPVVVEIKPETETTQTTSHTVTAMAAREMTIKRANLVELSEKDTSRPRP